MAKICTDHGESAELRAMASRDYLTTGRRIRAVRSALGLTQKEIGDALSISQNAWSQFETGNSRPRIDVMIALKRKWGVTLDFIYAGDLTGVPHKLAQAIEHAMKENQES